MLCCFFDLDGTLVDSRRPILRSLNHALETVGLDPVSAEEVHEFVGSPLHTQIPLYLERMQEPSTLSGPIMSSFRGDYEFACVEMAELYPGIKEVIAALADACALAIVTSKPVRYAEPILAAVDLRRYFEVVEGTDPDHAEPKAKTLQRALERMVETADCFESIMIGDRKHDVAAGRQLGIRTIGIPWGHGTEGELIAAGADTIARSPEELLRQISSVAQ